MKKGADKLRHLGETTGQSGEAFTGDVTILTSCPACRQGLSRYSEDASVQADYIVVEMARHVLGETWLQDYVAHANAGGIERVLV
jgi:Fe-S oxidoreductase